MVHERVSGNSDGLEVKAGALALAVTFILDGGLIEGSGYDHYLFYFPHVFCHIWLLGAAKGLAVPGFVMKALRTRAPSVWTTTVLCVWLELTAPDSLKRSCALLESGGCVLLKFACPRS